MDSKKRVFNENPLIKANFFSKLFFWWFTPIMALGQKKTLEEEDLYKPVPEEETEYLTNRLEKEWNKELLKKKPSLTKAILRVSIKKALLYMLYPLFEETIRVIQPIMIRNLIRYFNGQIDFKWALIYGTIICFNTIINGIVHHPYFYSCVRLGMRMRIAVCGLIYRKSLKLNTVEQDSSGKILNLISNDGSRIEMGFIFYAYLIVGPLQAIAIIILLLEMIDFSILSGILLLIIIIPLQSFFGKLLNMYKMKASKVGDERINLTSEILNGIKIIKMYCWESPIYKLIEKLRQKELNFQSVLYGLSAINSATENDMTCLITYSSVAIFINFANKPLLPGYVVFVIAYYMRICTSVGFFFIKALTCSLAAKVSVKRVQDLLLQPEIKEKFNNSHNNEKYVYINNLNAKWNSSLPNNTLDNITFEVKENNLLAIVGSVGSGKSSLLMAILNEMPSITGDIKLNGSVFYVSQEPWIFSSTIKQNILFGKEFSKDKFNRIIRICALKDDLKMFPNGENTIIGDKGVNLSGGQRARINLARAIYNDPDIYLFDDPLSAVDANVGQHLFDNCINGYLKNKIRILVTHQVHHLSKADSIIVMNEGKIQGKGKYDELISNKTINFSSLLSNIDDSHKIKTENYETSLSRRMSKVSETEKHPFDILDLTTSQLLNETVKENHVIEEEIDYEEKRFSGSIGLNVYKTLFSFGFASLIPILVLVLFILSQASLTLSDYWLSYWATQEESFFINNKKIMELFESCQNETNLTNNKFINNCSNFTKLNINSINDFDLVFHNRFKYFQIYSLLIGCSTFIILLRSALFYGSALLAAKNFHKKMLLSVMHAKIRFFDLNPIGRIMNRFTKDIGNLDDVLPVTLFDFLQCASVVLGSLIVGIVVNYWVLIPLIPLTILFVYIRKYFVNASREIKRIENLCRSPVYVHTSNSLAGIITIRASKNQKIMIDEYNIHSDYHTQAYFAFISSNRWFAIRLDSIVSIYSIFVIYGCIFVKDFMKLTSGEVGLVLVYMFQIMNLFQWTVRQSAEVENLMTSLERIIEYSSVKGENLNDHKIKPEKNWPNYGKIVFENVSYSYDDNLPKVLKDLTLTINPKEKIGIVGRTGAGKSTFFQAIFRMAEHNGRILIDDVNIKDISFNDLRSKISIIPQEPTLFTGTIRYNLDPFNNYNDDILWKTLEIVQLKNLVKDMNKGLDSMVLKGGSNISVGQKQLFCLARAILKKCKILIIDEATANVDYNTDALVQKAIRQCFKDCTVITIAHRLQTIMDSDKILCLSSGQLINYGRPYDLLQDKNSILYELVHKLGKDEEARLFEIAKRHVFDEISTDLNEFIDLDENDNQENFTETERLFL